ncbi:MAG: DUF2505 family protein [Actinomycetes bacterium]
MRFDATQRFAMPVDQLLALFIDPDFYPSLAGLPKISAPEVTSHAASGDVVRIDLHLRFTGDLPSAALAVIDPAKLSWIERITFDLPSASATTELLPDHYPDRLSCAGTYSFRAGDCADVAARSIRRLEGDLKVRMPLVGGRVERALVSGLREHADAEQLLVQQLFEQRSSGSK